MASKPPGEQDESDGEPPPEKSPDDPPIFFFEIMARGAKEVLINYRSQYYHLRATTDGKLILNK